MKSLIVVALIVLETALGFLLFTPRHRDRRTFDNVDRFIFLEEARVSVPNSASKGGSGLWFIFTSNSIPFAFEERTIVADAPYLVSKEKAVLRSGETEVWFCTRYRPLVSFVGKLVIMTFAALLFLGFCGWALQKRNIKELRWLR